LSYNDACLDLLKKYNDEFFNRLSKIQFIDKPECDHFGPVKDYQTLQGHACKTLFIDSTDISSVIYKQFSGVRLLRVILLIMFKAICLAQNIPILPLR
jgi:hypothetical protein